MLTEGKIFGNIILAVSKLEMQKTLLISVWRCSLVGQSVRFIPGRSVVRLHSPLPFFHQRVLWEFSSAGRASALQAEGHRFEPYNSHHLRPGSSAGQNASLSRQRSWVRSPSRSPFQPLQLSWQSKGLKILVSLVRFQSEAPGKCGSGSVVERHLAKVNVASSNLVFRSI